MDKTMTAEQIRNVNKIISGLDASLSKTYVHADSLKKYFDGEHEGVFTVAIDDTGKVTKLIFTGPSPENTALTFDPSQHSYKNCMEFIKYIAEQTGTNAIVLLDGTCIPAISIDEI